VVLLVFRLVSAVAVYVVNRYVEPIFLSMLCAGYPTLDAFFAITLYSKLTVSGKVLYVRSSNDCQSLQTHNIEALFTNRRKASRFTAIAIKQASIFLDMTLGTYPSLSFLS
jgi:hypothetical protein